MLKLKLSDMSDCTFIHCGNNKEMTAQELREWIEREWDGEAWVSGDKIYNRAGEHWFVIRRKLHLE